MPLPLPQPVAVQEVTVVAPPQAVPTGAKTGHNDPPDVAAEKAVAAKAVAAALAARQKANEAAKRARQARKSAEALSQAKRAKTINVGVESALTGNSSCPTNAAPPPPSPLSATTSAAELLTSFADGGMDSESTRRRKPGECPKCVAGSGKAVGHTGRCRTVLRPEQRLAAATEEPTTAPAVAASTANATYAPTR